MQKTRQRSVKTKENGIFSGLLFCADCKKAMGRNYARHGGHEFLGYICKTYKTAGKAFCESHAIRADELEAAVRSSLQEQAHKILKESDLLELKTKHPKSGREVDFQKQIDFLLQKFEKIEKYKKGALENQQDGLISKNDYISYVNDYKKQQEEIRKEIESLKQQKKEAEILNSKEDEWEKAFKNYIGIEKLDRITLLGLIERIEVYKDGSIGIHYKFRNPYET